MVFSLGTASMNCNCGVISEAAVLKGKSLTVKIRTRSCGSFYGLGLLDPLWDNSPGNGPDMKPCDLLGWDHVDFQYSSF